MVWIDTDALRALAATLENLRDELIPDPGGAPADVGVTELARAAAALAQAWAQLRVAQAREVDALATGAGRAAHGWEQAERLATGGRTG